MMAFAAWWMLWMTAVPAMGQQRQPKTAAKEQAKHQTATVNVRGSVMESERFEPLAGASVRLFNADSVMVCGNSTGADGQFLLPGVPQGKYVMKVTFVGFKPQQFSVDLTKKKGNFKTPDILLRENATLVAEAVVEGQMPEMVVVEDTVVYNADAFKLPEGSMVEELIKKLPGVVVDENGKYT
ncbi:MAG: carboxypeptidase-like regulatory domain-containing protein, partial [Bacteroidaceae bacterium]